MHGSGVGAEGGIREGGEVFCSMPFLALIDRGSHGHPAAFMRPYSHRESIQQSADMLDNRLVSLKSRFGSNDSLMVTQSVTYFILSTST
jgi:hypothetical protein